MVNEPTDFFKRYLHIVRGTEIPPFFHRWAMITSIGAWLGRDVWFEKGAFKVYPNLYVMLLGSPGTKKSGAIKRAKKFLAAAGYDSFSAEKTTKEKFLLDLSGSDVPEDMEGFLNVSLDEMDTTKCFIAADEFNDFFGNNILEFVSLLGVFWDFTDGVYKSKIKNGQSVEINNPIISILGGNTQTTFANTFPPEVVGQGFFSRLIAVYSEPSQVRITWPREPSDEDKTWVTEYLAAIKANCVGPMTISPEAEQLVDEIYQNWEPVEDERFASYSQRRLVHLLKLIVIHTAVRLSTEITAEDVRYANTILHHTEHYMPKAYGEFGRARNASVTHKVLGIIESADMPIGFNDIWEKVSNDLSGLDELGDIVRGLASAKKIQAVDTGFLGNKKVVRELHTSTVEYDYLTRDEIDGI